MHSVNTKVRRTADAEARKAGMEGLRDMLAVAHAEVEAARESCTAEKENRSTLTVDEWMAHLKAELRRMDVKAGVQTMCRVTGRFSGPPTAFWKYQRSSVEISRSIKLVNPEKHQQERKTWPQLIDVLCPDPRATSTYAKIVEWLEHEDVDVLLAAKPGVLTMQYRDSNDDLQGRRSKELLVVRGQSRSP